MREITMRTFGLLALTVAVASLTIGTASAERYYPWCSRYGWSTICGFDTFQQCQASVSGAGGYCLPNAVPPAGVERRVVHKRRDAR